jgi:RHS repeat-associated protein
VNVAAVREYALGLQRIDESQPINGTWTPSFYGYDGRGTVRHLTNLSGTVTDTYEYDAFGYLLTSTGTTPSTYLYRGEQYDANLGLYYLRARYYNPATGRFLGRDPEDGNSKDPSSLHKYLYAGGDPVNWIDPTGRDLIETGELDKETATEAPEAEAEAEGEKEALCVADDLASFAAYWASLAARAPVRSCPFNIINKYDLVTEELTGWTFYDEYGNRLYQVELAPTSRHGPGFHIYDQCGKIGFGNGPRGPHIPF